MPEPRGPIRTKLRLLRVVTASLMLSASILVFSMAPVWADRLGSRGLELGDSYPSATTTYKFFLTLSTSSNIGSIKILLCSNTPLIGDSCTIPAGLDVTHEHIVASSGLPAFSVYPVTTNELLISWGPTAFTAPQLVSVTLSDIVNPNATGSYYGRYTTYNTTNATGPIVDYGGLAFAINANLQVSSYVPPYLTFCTGIIIPTYDCASASGDYINFGSLSAAHSSQAASQILVATNADNGYIIQVYGITMTSGNNIISALGSNAASKPGSPQFGLNLRANTVPHIGSNPAGPGSGQPASGYNTPNSYRFVSNDIVASSALADNWRRYTASYLVNLPSDQPPGVYVSTLTYVGAGSF